MSRGLSSVPANVRSPNRQWALSPGDRERSSCPLTVIQLGAEKSSELVQCGIRFSSSRGYNLTKHDFCQKIAVLLEFGRDRWPHTLAANAAAFS
ncbi:MAG: hypothetical protein JO204_03885 [Alphaproteobacteria bacterium]|nr:hypothetical protein [Alphaproteobacteria bacterium]